MICDCEKSMIKKGVRNHKQRFRCSNCGNWKSDILRDGKSVLVIGDAHIPYSHQRYFDHVRRVRDKYKCDTVVNIGDMLDNNSINYHEKNPDGHSPGKEYEDTHKELRKWVLEFPRMKICIGSHDELPERKMKTIGLSNRMLKSINEIWDLPDTWVWAERFIIHDCVYQHGTGKSGKYMHLNWAIENMQSTVTGHGHGSAGIGFFACPTKLIFGMGVGCGVDAQSFAMQYGKHFGRKPIISCGVVTDYGKTPHLEPMEMK